MKTKNYAQAKSTFQAVKMIFRGIVLIVIVLLIGWTVGAQNFPDQLMTVQNTGVISKQGTINSEKENRDKIAFGNSFGEEKTPRVDPFNPTFKRSKSQFKDWYLKQDTSKISDAVFSADAEMQLNKNAAGEADLVLPLNQPLENSDSDAERHLRGILSRKIESGRTEKDFLNIAGYETGLESEQEVEKYSSMIISHFRKMPKK